MAVREPRTDTRTRIQQVALELFTERGYEKTSLREIAEHLGVTKAALYYHFKTKEDIVTSFFADFAGSVDEIIAWASDQQPTSETRREVVRRYSALVGNGWRMMMKFMHENQPAMRDLKIGEGMKERMTTLTRLVSDPSASLADQFRARLSIACIHVGLMVLQDADGSDEERAEAVLEVALELASK